MFIAALFTRVKRWKCPLMDQWTSKMWSYPYDGILFSLKRKAVLTPATTWVSLEDVMLREISQSLKNTNCMSPLI